MKSIRDMSQAEVAAYVQTHLAARGIDAVLSGGAAVSFYAGNLYVSKDIDLVADWPPRTSLLNKAMAEISFMPRHKYFAHPETAQIVEVLPGPITAGEEHLTRFNEVPLATGTLKVLTVTDCTKERLAAYFHWQDTQSLEQAVLIAQMHNVNLQEIRSWAAKEKKLQEFEGFAKRIATG